MAAVSSLADESPVREFALDVRTGLNKVRKELPSKYLYDAVGSALFDAITVLPEYGLTRADERLLKECAGEVARRLGYPVTVAELGIGSGRKTKPILQAIASRRPFLSFFAIDVSSAALDRCTRELSGVHGLSVHTIQRSYLDGLHHVRSRSASPGNLLVLFLGSTIGNFDRAQALSFLAQIRRELVPGDALLLGADLVKPRSQLLLAYDDPAGITAAFNLNLLCRINRELGADFEVRNFRHQARWLPEERRIEMHLESLSRQMVTITGADCRVSLLAGETIHTESSHKFDPAELSSMAAIAGFQAAAQWTDQEWPFAENLWIVR